MSEPDDSLNRPYRDWLLHRQRDRAVELGNLSSLMLVTAYHKQEREVCSVCLSTYEELLAQRHGNVARQHTAVTAVWPQPLPESRRATGAFKCTHALCFECSRGMLLKGLDPASYSCPECRAEPVEEAPDWLRRQYEVPEVARARRAAKQAESALPTSDRAALLSYLWAGRGMTSSRRLADDTISALQHAIGRQWSRHRIYSAYLDGNRRVLDALDELGMYHVDLEQEHLTAETVAALQHAIGRQWGRDRIVRAFLVGDQHVCEAIETLMSARGTTVLDLGEGARVELSPESEDENELEAYMRGYGWRLADEAAARDNGWRLAALRLR